MALRTKVGGGARPGGAVSDRVRWGWLRWSCRTLTSMRTAVVLLCLVGLGAIPGSLLPQRGVASDPVAVLQFADEHPDLAPWLDRLGLFGVYASPWFAAIYLLLMVSMTGCVIPRLGRLWRGARAAPSSPPTNLSRQPLHREYPVLEDRGPHALTAAATALEDCGFRVSTQHQTVSAERGYLREFGNLAFHLSLLVLLVGIGVGRLFGFEGRVALAEGDTFANVVSQYDVFTPSTLTDTGSMTPFAVTLEDFDVRYETTGAARGDPRSFDATLAVASGGSGTDAETVVVRPNEPLDVDGTKMFLSGHGYAPVVTVRDGRGDVVKSGPVIFLPMDGSYTSDGVVKVPDARPEGLGFEGFFLPTAARGENGPYSAFPDALNPQLFLTAYRGDLGLDRPQSVYELDKEGLTQLERGGKPLARALKPGDVMRLPDGLGSLTFDGVARFANFQVARDPGKEISLAAAVLLLVGLTMSLAIPRRRYWLRLRAGHGSESDVLELAGRSLTRRDLPPRDLDRVEGALVGFIAIPPTPTATPRSLVHVPH